MHLTSREATVVRLNQILAGELSAVEAYCQAIEHIEDKGIMAILQETHNCHAKRINMIVRTMRELGLEPDVTSGAWGALTKFIEGGAQLFGDRATIDVLEEGEAHGLRQYEGLLKDQDTVIRKMAFDLLPKQESTHNILRDLQLSLT